MANISYQVLRELMEIADKKTLQKNAMASEGQAPKQLILNNTEHQYSDVMLDFIAGCLGGAAGVIVSHPLDTAKVHLQTQDPKNPRYHGTFHCLRTIVAQENVAALYRGMTSPLAGISFVNAIVFGVYGNVQRATSDPDALSSHILAGGVAGICQSVVCSPMELAKTRVQVQSNTTGKQFKGPLDCITHIMRTEGIRGVYRGFISTVLRDIPGFGAYFGSYEYMMRLQPSPNVPYILCAGGLAGIASWLCCYAIDVVKTCIQADDPAKPIYKGYYDVIQKGYESQGIRFFFRGISSTMIRSFPMNAVTFFVVAYFLAFFRSNDTDSVLNRNRHTLVINLAINTPTNPIYNNYNNYHNYHNYYKHNEQESSIYNDLCDHKCPAKWPSLSTQHLTTFGTFSDAIQQTEALELVIPPINSILLDSKHELRHA